MPPSRLSDTELLTVEQYEKLPEEEYGDLVRGRLVREPRPGGRHGVLVGRLSAKVGIWLEQHRIGVLVTDGGFLLHVEPPTVRGPDVAVVRADRLPAGVPRGFFELAPDLAVEVVSPFTTAAALHEKALEYLAAGTALVWLVYPDTRTVVVHRAPDESEVVCANGTLTGEPVLPGFELPLEQLFRSLGG